LILSREEVGWNISTVALRVVEGYENEPGAWGCNWVILSLGDINTELVVGPKADDLAL
jgi:hypothetical protein